MQNEKDFFLKTKLMKILWNMKYFVRDNIPLCHYKFGSRTNNEVTDIDVFGIKFDYDFDKKVVYGDCKSGKTVKNSDRLLWFGGLIKAYAGNRGFFIKSSIDESKYMQIAQKLDITIFSEDQLDEIISHFNHTDIRGPFLQDEILYRRRVLKKYKNINTRIYNYLESEYWYHDVNSQIKNIMTCIKRIDDSSLDQQDKAYLLMYCINLLSISVISFSKDILMIPLKKHEFQIANRFTSTGGFEANNKRILLSGFYNFMKTELKRKYNVDYDLNEKEFFSFFYPPYISYLVDLIERICMNQKVSILIPIFVEFINCKYSPNQTDIINQLEITTDEYDMLVKLVKDIIMFLKQSNHLSENGSEQLMTILNRIDIIEEDSNKKKVKKDDIEYLSIDLDILAKVDTVIKNRIKTSPDDIIHISRKSIEKTSDNAAFVLLLNKKKNVTFCYITMNLSQSLDFILNGTILNNTRYFTYYESEKINFLRLLKKQFVQNFAPHWNNPKNKQAIASKIEEIEIQ